jgi:mitogen-activated protein kinase organizer 1
VTLSENNSIMLTGSDDKRALVYDLRNKNNKPIQILDQPQDSVTSVSICDHEIFVASMDEKLRTFDIRMGRQYQDDLHESLLQVQPYNQCYTVSTLESRILMIDKSSGKTLNEYKGHVNQKYKIDFCFVEKSIYCGSEDGNLCEWNILGKTIANKTKISSHGLSAMAVHNSTVAIGSTIEGMIYIKT